MPLPPYSATSSKMDVICPRCAKWFEDDVDDREFSLAVASGSIPIARLCKSCESKQEAECAGH